MKKLRLKKCPVHTYVNDDYQGSVTVLSAVDSVAVNKNNPKELWVHFLKGGGNLKYCLKKMV